MHNKAQTIACISALYTGKYECTRIPKQFDIACRSIAQNNFSKDSAFSNPFMTILQVVVFTKVTLLQRQLCEILIDLHLQLKKIGKIFIVRLITSSYRAVKALWNDYTQPSMSILKSFQKTCPLNPPNVQLTRELIRSYQQENLSRMWQSLKIAWLNYPCSQTSEVDIKCAV